MRAMQTHFVCRLVLGCLIVLGISSRQAVADGPPNIILINCDNLGYGDLGAYGSRVHRTPNLDQLAAQGVRFTDFYAASPVCTSSRSALLTGCYPRRNNMHDFEWDGAVLRPVSPNGLHPDEITVAELLKERGYYTACIGKWHLGDQHAFLPLQQGFATFFGLLYSDEMDDSYRIYRWPPMPLLRDNTVIEAPADLETMTERYTQEAIRIIREPRHRPFFIYLPHMSPGSRKEPIAGGRFQGRSANGSYGDTVEEIDWSTGQILEALEDAGLSDRTLLIFTADNGAPPPRGTEHHGSNAPFRAREGYDASEGGFRVPMIARWPGRIPSGAVCREVATNMDLFTTVLQLAGAQMPTDRVIDGKDIWPLLASEPDAASPHDAFFYYFADQLQAVRSGRWKLVLPLSRPIVRLDMGRQGIEATGVRIERFGEPVTLQLYDMEQDVQETTNVAQRHPGVVARLMKLAESARDDLGDVDRQGSGVRPAGLAPDPSPQLLDRPDHKRP